MKISVLYLVLILMAALPAQSRQSAAGAKAAISADSARISIRELVDELAKKHPGFYRYNAEADFQRFIDSSLVAIAGDQDELSFYRNLKPIIARIRCLHTTVSLSVDYQNELNAAANMLPLDLYLIGDKAWITGNYTGDGVLAPGTEVLSINGKTVQDIKAQLFANIASDGFNESLKYQLINNRFAQSYRTNIEVTDKFTILIKGPSGPQSIHINAVKNDKIPVPEVMDLKNKPRLSLAFQNTAAVLTVRSFADTEIKAGGQQFKKFIAGSIAELNKKGIKNLVIDLRNNTGGTDVNAAYLCSYLMDKPYRYWERIEVTEPFALSIKGSARLMYGKPVKKDSVYLWPKSKFSHEFDFTDPQQPNKDRFSGNVYVIINGACLSSCADLAAVLQANKRAVFIGEETGGGYQGNTSGLIPQSSITFGITVSVPLLKYINAVDPLKNTGRGTMPDIAYARTLSDILNNADPEMDLAMKLLTP